MKENVILATYKSDKSIKIYSNLNVFIRGNSLSEKFKYKIEHCISRKKKPFEDENFKVEKHKIIYNHSF